MQATDPWLSRYSKLVVAATFCLIFLGGVVTTLGAGLSVPDWPTSYGYNMFTFPISKWVGGIAFEHTHRLLASCVGLMVTVLVAWIWRNRWAVLVALVVSALITGAVAVVLSHVQFTVLPGQPSTRGLIIMHVNIWSFALAFSLALLNLDRRRWRHGPPWLQWLSFAAFLLVCVQGTLGGLRVTEVSIVLAMVHACTAQAFLVLTVVMATALSPRWSAQGNLSGQPSISGLPMIQTLGWVLVCAVFVQLILGAIMRHLGAGLAIPTFPSSFGYWVPPVFNERIAIHFAHRAGALVITLLTAGLIVLVFRSARMVRDLTRAVVKIGGLLLLQVALGASVIWLRREPILTSLHVVNGAAVLASTVVFALRATRLNLLPRLEDASFRPSPASSLREVHA